VVGELTVAENLVLEKLEDYTRNGLLTEKPSSKTPKD